jgi:hypothetical protein
MRKWALEQAVFGPPWSGQSPVAISLSQPLRQHSGRGKSSLTVDSVRGADVVHATSELGVPMSSVRW